MHVDSLPTPTNTQTFRHIPTLKVSTCVVNMYLCVSVCAFVRVYCICVCVCVCVCVFVCVCCICVCLCVCVCQVLTNDLMCSNKPSYSGGLFRTPVAFALKHNFTFQCVCTKASSRVCLLPIRPNDLSNVCADA